MEEGLHFLDIFTDQEIKDKLSELISATETIAKREPVVGFHKKFYIPGLIGVFQLSSVESKMSKFANEKFYNDMSYYDFADWIIGESHDIAEKHINNKPQFEDDMESYDTQSKGIIHAFNVIMETWAACCPEVATHCNLKYTENTTISPVGMVYKALQANLKDLGYPQSMDSVPNNMKSFKEETKDFFYMIAGYIINVLLLGAVFGILGAIFG